MAIPNDVRQFQLKHLFWVTLSLCLPSSLIARFPAFGVSLLVGASSFWIGVGLLFISDTIDSRPIDDRGWVSQGFNLIGIFIVAFSLIGVIVVILLAAAFVVSSVFN